MGTPAGYAAAGGDTGHQTATPDDLLWGVGHPARIEDWGSRSIHAITHPARLIARTLTDRMATRSYFYGCSTGGHQAYVQMQRYPEDFDGIVAGAPGNNRIRLNAGFLWQFHVNRERGVNNGLVLPAAKLPLITQAVLDACDSNDGVADGVVDEPRTCRFNPQSLRCSGEDCPFERTRRNDSPPRPERSELAKREPPSPLGGYGARGKGARRDATCRPKLQLAVRQLRWSSRESRRAAGLSRNCPRTPST